MVMSTASRIKQRIGIAWRTFVKRNIVDDDPYQDEISYEIQEANMAYHAAHPVHTVPFTIQGKFEEFHKANPEVYKRLVELAYQAQKAGFKTYSINSLFERLRWHYNIDVRTNGFTLNNNYRRSYARLIMEQEPGLSGFFNTRVLTAA